jgi:hypothetical protein
MMKNIKPFRSLSMGFATLGLVLSQQGCGLQWLKDRMGCSHCKEVTARDEGAVPALIGTQSAGSSDYSSYEIDISPNNSGREMIRFAPGKSLKIAYTLHNAPVITYGGFEDRVLAMVGQMMPKGFDLSSLPKQQRSMLVADIVKIESLRRVEIESLLRDESFRKKLAQRLESDLNGLVFEYVLERVKSKISVSADDVASEYEENKGRYIKELGGVRLAAAKYNNAEDAQQFLAALTEKDVRDISDFSKEAKDTVGKFRDFGLVSKEFPRGADSLLVEAVENFSEYPSLDIVSLADNEHWVLLATESKSTVYYTFEECKQRIASMMEQRLVEKMISDYIDTAKDKVGAEIISADFADEKKEVDEDDSAAFASSDTPSDDEDSASIASLGTLSDEDSLSGDDEFSSESLR